MNTTSFTPNKSAGRHTAYLTATNGPLVADFEAAADRHIAALSVFHTLGGRDNFDVLTVTNNAMAAAREAVLASTDYRPPAIVLPPVVLTRKERIELLGVQHGLTGLRLGSFVTQTHAADTGIQTFADAAYRLAFACKKKADEKVVLAAHREWESTI